jgi:hypothetical protein
LRAVVLGVLAVVALGACRVETEVGLTVEEDGSGMVEVGIGLDDDALGRVPGIADELRVEDLQATGWTVVGPVEEADGYTWFRISKPFATPEEAAAVLTEVTGVDGPIRDLRVERERPFARTTYGFEGTVDLAAGLEGFGDDALAALLDGEPLGEDVAAIEARFGESIDAMFGLRVVVDLPGDESSNAPTETADGAVWEFRLASGAPVELRAASTEYRSSTLALTAIGALAVLGALGVAGRGRWVGRRRRSTDPAD